MSSLLRSRSTAAKAAVLAATIAGGLAFGPASASADFTLAKCGGSAVKGVGASFQNGAQAGWIAQFAGPNGCDGKVSIEGYDGTGSGAGRQALGERNATNNPLQARNPNYRYAAADEAPTASQRAQIEAGPIDVNGADVTAADNGKLHVIPAAVGATTIIVNYPDGCTLPAASATSANGPGTGNQNARLKLSNADVEKVFGGETTTWGGLVPGIAELAGSGRNTGDCAALPIKRIVRSGDSGTTYSIKSWLNEVNGARGWGTTYGASPNTTWPVSGAPTAPDTSATCPADKTLCSGPTSSNSGSALATLLTNTDGAVGYADIRTAINAGYTVTAAAAPAAADTTYWIQVTGKDGVAYEPTSDSTRWQSNTGIAGANCANAVFSNLPASTLGDFSKVTGATSPTGYPICVVTYLLAWDDYAPVYGNTDAEQAKARTVKDYVDMILEPVAQSNLALRDYQALPPALLTLAKSGAASASWNKAAAGGGGTENPGGGGGGGQTPPPAAGGGGAVVTPPAQAPPVVTAPSNVFTVQSATVSKAGVLSATLRLPGAGAVAVTGKAKSGKKTITVGSAKGTATSAGNLVVTLKPSSKAKKALAKTGKLKVTLTFSFTPAGGTASTVQRTVTFKAKKAKAKKKPAKKKSTKKQAARR